MCGIAGIVNNSSNNLVSEDAIDKMCRVIKHRGPDHTGIKCEGSVGLGMTRLSIIDRSGGFQPIHNEDKTVWIVFNGEIYNFQSLKSDLIIKGHTFYTQSDTEVIVHLYEEYGYDCVKHLRGMFAFALWDSNSDKLFAARDRLGIKPFHYCSNSNGFIFGSEIKSILASGKIESVPDYQELVHYFFYGYTPDSNCLFKDIKKLLPGHYIVWQDGKVDVNRYWDVIYNPDFNHSEDYFIERTIELIKEAVKIRLISEVPLGAFLSGGVDSSLVVAMMAQEMTEPVKTFSIGFDEQNYDELKYARMVSERYGTNHHEEIVRPDAESVIEDLINQFDEPFADSSAIPTYYVSKMTKKWVTVSLSGDGGDEIFGGYTRYKEGLLTKVSRFIPNEIKKFIQSHIISSLPLSSYGINSLCYLTLNNEEQIITKYSKLLSPFYKRIFSNEISELVNTNPAPIFSHYLSLVSNKDRLSQLQYLDTKTYLPGDILTKIDRTSMLVSLEARVPLLDHHLVEFAATIPSKFKLCNGETKYLLKKIAEKFLPYDLIYRPKQGFAVPIEKWIRNEWKDMCYELVLGEKALKRNIFNVNFLKHIVNEHMCGRRDNNYIIWTLMVLEMWFRKYIDSQIS